MFPHLLSDQNSPENIPDLLIENILNHVAKTLGREAEKEVQEAALRGEKIERKLYTIYVHQFDKESGLNGFFITYSPSPDLDFGLISLLVEYKGFSLAINLVNILPNTKSTPKTIAHVVNDTDPDTILLKKIYDLVVQDIESSQVINKKDRELQFGDSKAPVEQYERAFITLLPYLDADFIMAPNSTLIIEDESSQLKVYIRRLVDEKNVLVGYALSFSDRNGVIVPATVFVFNKFVKLPVGVREGQIIEYMRSAEWTASVINPLKYNLGPYLKTIQRYLQSKDF